MSRNACSGICHRLTPYVKGQYRYGLRFCPRCARAFRDPEGDACPCCGHRLRFKARKVPLGVAVKTAGTRRLAHPDTRFASTWSPEERQAMRAYQKARGRGRRC